MTRLCRVVLIQALDTWLLVGVLLAGAPSTPHDREKAVSLVAHLEQDPFATGARAERQWLTAWLSDVSDISVTLCTEFFPSLATGFGKYGAELAVQSAFSMAAFIIEHPDAAKDETARYVAAVNGTLRTYESMRRQEQGVRWPELDRLLAVRDRDQLAAFVAATEPKCRSR